MCSMPSVSRWKMPCGAIVIKYRMTPNSFMWLRYEHGESLEGGDYSSHKSLRDARNHTNNNHKNLKGKS